ncbi:SDR family NAD(P)-dependent oxidoreductase [Labrys monachus]|uniref:NAD(P)-dependent dehydrogenase (Short-subunit alcohol dehydrogenase family) n=1 Tax=Labrys monachus TaxID=217067 RepID=A0ABU0FGL5_9HYPH|nr:SDR family NAD(P)-dependent oxidoreductase [Labrys monachus]MDQ0393754.1 NAD(P)-dependent dehydrogenase (short-subunit alcohol dehydrogenase family) [Labrys monachus]
MDKHVILVTGAGSGIGNAIATALARAGHIVYASLRLARPDGQKRAAAIRDLAAAEKLDLRVIDLDVLSEASCRAAVDQVLVEQNRIDVVVNNAGMLMTGVTEAFDPDQLQHIFDTNATSWLRVNRAVLPVMRRQGRGTLAYVSSTTAHIPEPFLGPYVAAKAAGEALAEVMGMEVRSFGIDTVIMVPGAFTSGTEHFAHANTPALPAVVAQYGAFPARAETLGNRLVAIDAAHDGSLDVSAVGEALRDALAKPSGERPFRIFVDAQRKGVEDILSVQDARQADLLRQFGLSDLAPPAW